jgi:hypothetical protein
MVNKLDKELSSLFARQDTLESCPHYGTWSSPCAGPVGSCQLIAWRSDFPGTDLVQSWPGNGLDRISVRDEQYRGKKFRSSEKYGYRNSILWELLSSFWAVLPRGILRQSEWIGNNKIIMIYALRQDARILQIHHFSETSKGPPKIHALSVLIVSQFIRDPSS